jgi:hypothetical protein
MAGNILSITRRDYLAIIVASIVTVPVVRLWLARGCRCGAQIRCPHECSLDRRSYCPNCGRDLVENGFRLETRSKGWWRLRVPAEHSWDPAQVPFPNPLLVQTTSKPVAVMSRVRLQGTPNLRSAVSRAW